MAYNTGVTIKHRTAANDSPNMMHTAIAPKNGSFSSGIIPRTVVMTTMHTGRILAGASVEDRLVGRLSPGRSR